ncbi:ferredoxin domain-containing protein [Methanorbis rubei]|uniref:4Fe-4S domain-containing protein n=1 Tax=Methanorbis rubei TaxID=3028300 RepID=A0AAE4SC08_9EURY|nr:hypothetical protein [Methanocorpusculaceae archaeon Cs1]
MISEIDTVEIVAGLMMVAARTAPKAMAVDSIVTKIVAGKELESFAKKMDEIGEQTGMTFFNTNANHLRAADLMVLIGVKGCQPLGANCGGCGHATCAEFGKEVRAAAQAVADYPGPNCIFKVTDLGIAVGSAVKCAASHNVDNRVMYTAGVAAKKLQVMDECSIVYGIPLKASGKNIFFADPVMH